ncbi:MAG TPA: response regulator transcription factor [Haliangiales bacterium]|nr:response regulator transcription factor [Haliangiales bacterium]
MIRVVLADDHNIVRAGLRALLQGLPDVEVVAEAADGREALAAVAAHRPDVALIDIAMPGLNGLEAAARIAKDAPGTRVVILSMHSGESYVAQALRVGVSGYVLKDAFSDELPVLLRSVMRGETYLSPGISKQVVDRLRARLDEGDTSPDALTPRQREILQLLAEGKSTKEIAHLLGVSVKTVETHRAQIMERLDIHDLPGLVKYAIRAGLTSEG